MFALPMGLSHKDESMYCWLVGKKGKEISNLVLAQTFMINVFKVWMSE